MPKSATKAAQNVFYLARMEAATCNDRLASREGASEEVGMSLCLFAKLILPDPTICSGFCLTTVWPPMS